MRSITTSARAHLVEQPSKIAHRFGIGDAYHTIAYTRIIHISPGSAQLSISGRLYKLPLARSSLTRYPSLFGSEPVGTTSSAQSVTLTSSGTGSLTITGIAIAGDIALATTGTSCPYTGGSLASGDSCTIDVTFKPTSAGTRNGSVTATDNDSGVAGSTQTLSLGGTGEDFTLAIPSGSSSSATASPGQTVAYTLTVGGEGGFNQAVSFSCTGAPSESTCTAPPNPVTVGGSATNVTVTVTTTAPSIGAPRTLPQRRLPGPQALVMLAVLFAGVAWTIRGRRQGGTSWRRTLPLALAAGLLLAFVTLACGGGGGGGGRSANPGTRAGTYTLTVTSTAGSGCTALTDSVTLTLVVS